MSEHTLLALASIIIALVFLYMIAAIFIIGAELNAAIMRYRSLREQVSRLPSSPEPRRSS